MKKLFMFLAVAGLATFGASCSSDDSKNDDPVKKDLVLSGKTDVKEGDAVTFTVKVGDKAETGTDLYVDGVKAANPHTFSKVGEYKVQAKKNGFNDSNVLTVKVSEKGGVDPEPEPDPKTLVLSVVGGTEAIAGQEVIFLVKDNEGNNVTGTVIKKDGTTVSNPWTPTEAGTFKFVASKEGYENSNEVTVNVTVVDVPEGNFVKIGNKYYNIENMRLKANASQQGNDWIIYRYQDEDPTKQYSVWAYEYYELNEAEDEYVVRAMFQVVTVYEKDGNIVLPGTPGATTQFLGGFATDFDISGPAAEFEFEDIVTYTVPTPGQNGVVNFDLANANGQYQYNGAYTGIGVLPVGSDGRPNNGIRAVDMKSNNKFVKSIGVAKLK